MRNPLRRLGDVSMHSGGWITLLRLIPLDQQPNLTLTLLNGIEIAVQSLPRFEKDYVVVRGRQTGVAEGGSFFFVPFDQILFLGFQKAVNEAVLRAMYGETFESAAIAEGAGTPASESVPAQAPSTPLPEPAAVPLPGGPAVPPRTPGAPDARPVNPNKAALLERLRSRRSEGAASPT